MESEKSDNVGGGSPIGSVSVGGQGGEGNGPGDPGEESDAAVETDGGSAADAEVVDVAQAEEVAPVDAGAESGADGDDAADVASPGSRPETATDVGVDAGAPVEVAGPDGGDVSPPHDGGTAEVAADVSVDTVDAAAEAATTDVSNATETRTVEAGPPPGPDSVVTLFNKKYLYYGSEDTRRADATVAFPSMPETYDRITVNMTLTCPPGGCDLVEKRGFLGVVRKTPQGADSITELVRFVSPAGVGATWSADVTALRPMLAGAVTVRVFIETWVGPGNPGGAGYVVDATADFHGGRPARRPIAVIPIWDETSFVHGDPAAPGAAAVAPRNATLPAGTTAVDLRAIITGHGQGNLDGCGAFCKKTHRFVVGTTAFDRTIWRDDCATTAAPGQQGAWMAPRAGWCPGAVTVPWVTDVTAAFAGAGAQLSYAVADYVNTCRPGAPVCSGCSMGNGCAYNGSTHTPPTYYVAALLIAYGP